MLPHFGCRFPDQGAGGYWRFGLNGVDVARRRREGQRPPDECGGCGVASRCMSFCACANFAETGSIGVPGGSTAAVMMIVLQYHGVVLGPRLFVENPTLAYGVFVAIVIARPSIEPLYALVASSLVAMVFAYLGMRFAAFRKLGGPQ